MVGDGRLSNVELSDDVVHAYISAATNGHDLLARIIGQSFGEIYGINVLSHHIDSHLYVIISMFIYMSRGRSRARNLRSKGYTELA